MRFSALHKRKVRLASRERLRRKKGERSTPGLTKFLLPPEGEKDKRGSCKESERGPTGWGIFSPRQGGGGEWILFAHQKIKNKANFG